MGFSVESAFATHQRALGLRAYRAEVLAHNITNADTPGYQARDFDFADAMRGAGIHAGAGTTPAGVELAYRRPLQSSLDQNTVETPVEQAAFMDNALHYQIALTLLNRKIDGLLTAITGQ